MTFDSRARTGVRLSVAALILVSAMSTSLGVRRAAADVGSGGGFVALTPNTIANTSNGTGGLGATPFASGETRTMAVGGLGGVPSSNVAAAVLEIVASNQTTSGALSVYPDDLSAPTTTDLSFDASNKASGFAIVALGADGGIKVRSVTGNPNLIVTVEGYFTSTLGAGSPGGYNTVNEVQVLDLTSTPLAAGATTTLQIGGNNGVASDAGSVFINVETSSASTSGGIFVWPHGEAMPNAATLRWTPGLSSTGALVALGSNGSVDIYNSGTQSVAVTMDLDGYFAGGTPSGGAFNVAADRVLDTTLPPATAVGPGATVAVPVAGAAADLPPTGMATVALNLSVTSATTSGGIRAWGTGFDEPTTTDLSYDAVGSSSALTIAPVGSDGTVTIRNLGSAQVNVAVDAQGWFGLDDTDVVILTTLSADEIGSFDTTHLNELAGAGSITILSNTADPNTDTPDGYILWDPGYRRSNYTYDSNWINAYDTRSGKEAAGVKIQFRETALGGVSHQWKLIGNATTLENPQHISWYFQYTYFCGIDIAGGNDHICDNDASVSGATHTLTPGESNYEYFGARNGLNVFPMFKMSVHWSTGDTANMPFRGWDTTTASSTTQLRAKPKG